VRLKALLLSLAVVATQLVHAQHPVKPSALPPTRDQLLSLFGSYIETLRVQAGIPGMVGVIVGDSPDLLWQQPFGYQDIGAVARTQTDTAFQFDGLTQLVTATMVLQCVDQGKIRLDTPVGQFTPSFYDAGATIQQVLSHTSGTSGNLSFNYTPQRLDALKFVVETCTGLTFRQAMKQELERVGMMASVPGPDAALPELKNPDVASPADAARYRSVLQRLATPYAVDALGLATSTTYGVKTLGAQTGLVSTALDFAKFDLALKQDDLLLRRETRVAAWSNPVNTNGQVLPHGMGWFVQTYNGEPVVWQFGISPAASSSLLITLPNRNVTLILLANSDGLARPASLSAGDVTVSPFARVFLGLVVK
jgi:CubicO group peptidase (beta-lactamase class C family)